MNGDDSIFDFPYLAKQWHVMIERPTTLEEARAGLAGKLQCKYIICDGDTEDQARERVAEACPDWSVRSIQNSAVLAAERMANMIAYIFRD